MPFHADALRQPLADLYHLYGCQPASVALVDEAELYLANANEDVIRQLYAFDRGGKTYVLRPEFTTAAMKQYLESHSQQQQRCYFFDSTFQAHPTAGRPIRSMTAGVEIICDDSIDAEVDAVLMAWHTAQRVSGAMPQVVLYHVGIVLARLHAFGLDDYLVRTLQQQPALVEGLLQPRTMALPDVDVIVPVLDTLLHATQHATTMGGRSRRDIAERLARQQRRHQLQSGVQQAVQFLARWRASSPTVETMDELAALLKHCPAAEQQLERWQRLITLLVEAGLPQACISLSTDSHTQWQYYSGVTFHMQAEGLRLVSGGRYDHLSQMMGAATPVPAVGFACLLETTTPTKPTSQGLLVRGEHRDDARRVVYLLRWQGIAARLAAEDETPSLTVIGKQLSYADQPFDSVDKLVAYLRPLP